jgi:hypothetical protein
MPQILCNLMALNKCVALSFGEWTNGSMATADNSININTFNLDANTFIPYIVGTSASQNLGNNQRISYRLADLSHASCACRAKHRPINTA